MPVPPDGIPASTFDHDITADEPQAPTQAEGANPTEHTTVSAGTSRSGRVRIMSQRMAESVSQRDFFGTTRMHYMAQASTIDFDDTAYFSGLWNKALAPVDPSTSKSRSGWIIFYAGCPVSWASKLQSQVALSTTEAEYIAMSQALRDVIPIMGLLQEMREQDFKVLCNEPHVYCKVFEDNSGALELARLPKLCPRTKHINVCYHHFREHVRKGLIKIFPVDTKDQIADALTKALAQNDFQRHHRYMCGK
jgi:hypothetical protein